MQNHAHSQIVGTLAEPQFLIFWALIKTEVREQLFKIVTDM
jgi:hypothetical protein